VKPFFVICFLALLPCLVSAGYYWDSDTNTLIWDGNVSDTNVLDVNVGDLNTGPIMLKLTFEHTVIGDVPDSNNVSLVFTQAGDYAFEIEIADLTSFYALDFVEKEVQTYISDVLPEGWNPMLTLKNTSKTFRVNNLIGDCDPDLFLLIKSDGVLRIEHLEVGEWITLSTVQESKYFLLVDADDFGTGSFSLDFEDFEISASINFLEMPSKWSWVEEKGFSCDDAPEDRCLIIPSTGESWNVDKCLDSSSELNVVLGDNPGIDICIQGSAAHQSWYKETLERKLKLEQEARVLAESKSDPELASKIGLLQGDISAMKSEQTTANLLADEGLNELLLALCVCAGVVLVAFVVSRKALPMQPITHFGNNLKEKILEVSENVRKKEGKGKGEGSEGGEENEGGRVVGSTGNGAKGSGKQWFQRGRRF